MSDPPFFQRTPEEKVDVLDDALKVFYQTTKLEAHKNGLLHKTVVGQVRDSKGRILLVKQSETQQDVGQFVAPVGGHIQAYETHEQALKREALEEIGLENFEFKHIGNFIFERKVIGRHENHYFIVFEIQTDEMPVLSEESEDFRFFTKDELRKILKENPELISKPAKLIFSKFYPELAS